MYGVFQNIDPHPPSPPGEYVPPPPLVHAGGGHTRWVERGWGFNILEDAIHCYVLYIRQYFVGCSQISERDDDLMKRYSNFQVLLIKEKEK
jgi:hypothetical protein